MEKMLLLLLGLAINGEYKEAFIEQIQTKLDTQLQLQLVPYIQLVTEDLSFSISKSVAFLQDPNCQAPAKSSGKKNQLPSIALTSSMTTMTTTLTNTLAVDLNASNDANENMNSPRDCSIASNASSTSSFVQTCQQLTTSTMSITGGGGQLTSNANATLVVYSDMQQFINSKLLPNLQRIVDERDSYLESIIELQQDKDFLNYQLSNNGSQNGAASGPGGLTANMSSASLLIAAAKHISANGGFASGAANSCCLDTNTNTTSSSSTSPNAVKTNSGNSFDLKAYISEVLVELIQNMSNQQQQQHQQQLSSNNAKTSTTAQSGKDSSSAASNSSYLNGSLIDLSDTQNLINILESVHKEIAASKPSNNSDSLTKNGADLDHQNLSDEFQVKKLVGYNNWSQKIAVELVECKIRFRQLVNDM